MRDWLRQATTLTDEGRRHVRVLLLATLLGGGIAAGPVFVERVLADEAAVAAVEAEADIEELSIEGIKAAIEQMVPAEIVAGFVALKELFDFLFGGIDGLNTQITNLFKLAVDAQTKLMQANVDAAGMRLHDDLMKQVALTKTTSTAQVAQWCFTQHANRVAEDAEQFRKAGTRYLAGNPYVYSVGGKIYAAPCSNTGSGHAQMDGASASCDSTQATTERLTLGCALGALDRYDVANTTIGKTTCSTAVSDAFGKTRALGSDPEVIFMSSLYLPPNTDSNDPGSSQTDVGVRERLFQIQMFYCNQIRGNVAQVPVGAGINTMAGGMSYSASMKTEAAQRIREQVCIDTVMDHSAFPCNTKAKGYSNFGAVCDSMKALCTNHAKLIDVSIYPGCADSSGSLSPSEVRDIRRRTCANAQASVNKASSTLGTPAQVQKELQECSAESEAERALDDQINSLRKKDSFVAVMSGFPDDVKISGFPKM